MDVGKLRQVLDYMPCETCLDIYTPEQDYFCGICARLNREIVVRKNAVGADEAVQVILPEEYAVVVETRERVQRQEQELEEARSGLARLQSRETDLQQEVKDLKTKLEKARKEKAKPKEPELVPFGFVGVKGEPVEDVMEFAEESEPEPVEFTPATAPADATWVAGAPASETPSPEATMAATPRKAKRGEDAIQRIEDEIAKIEMELEEIAEQEQALVQKGVAPVPSGGRTKRSR